MKYPILLLAPSNHTTDSINFRDQVDKNKTKDTLYNIEILEELTKARELYRRGIEKDDIDFVQNALNYLSILSGFVFIPDIKPHVEAHLEKEIVEEVREVVDDSGMVTLIRTGESGQSSKSDLRPSLIPKPKATNQTSYSKLRYSFSFIWKNGSKHKVDANDSLYETCMVLVTIANMYLRQAKVAVDAERRKDAFKLLSQALGIYGQIEIYCHDINKTLLRPLPFDLSLEKYSMLMTMLIKAQLQEVGTYTAIEKEDKHELVAKLSRGTSDAYQTAFKSISGEKDNTSFIYKQFLDLKNNMWMILCHMYAGVYSNYIEDNGNAVVLVNHAKSLLTKTEKAQSQYQNMRKDANREQYDFIVGQCNRFSEKFTRENSMVYHHKVPDKVNDLPLPAQMIGKAVQFEFPAAHQLWTSENYAAFNLPLAKTVQVSQLVPISESTSSYQNGEEIKKEETTKREREEIENVEENVKKSTRYDSGGVSLCIIF
jgi:hypothetical protein